MRSPLCVLFRLMIAAGASAALLCSVAPTHAAPIVYRGELTAANGLPYTGEVDVSAALYGSMAAPTPLWEAAAAPETVMGGILDYRIDDPGIDALLQMHGDLWIEFTIDGETLSPRQELARVPYAAVAGNAMTLDGMSAGDFMAAGDSLAANALPTNGIGQISNGALNNEFQNVAYLWTGAQTIGDNPDPGAQAEVTSIETGNSYLTALTVETGYSLSFGNEIEMVLYPPPSSSLAPIVLEAGAKTAGMHNMTWTPGNMPALGDILGLKIEGTWTLTVTDTDNNAAPGVAVGQLQHFRVSYDVVRSDHLQIDGRLEVATDLDVGGDARIEGMLIAPGVPMNTKAYRSTTHYNLGTSWIDGPAWTYEKKLADSDLLVQGAFPYYVATTGGSGYGIRVQYDLGDGIGFRTVGLAAGPGNGWGAGGYGGNDAGITPLMEFIDEINAAGTIQFKIQARKWSASDTVTFIAHGTGGAGSSDQKRATWIVQEIPR